MNACIKYGWNETESKENPVVVVPTVELKYPDGWTSLTDALVHNVIPALILTYCSLFCNKNSERFPTSRRL